MFQDLQTGTRIGSARECGGSYYLDNGAILFGLVVVSSDTLMQ